MKKVKAWFETVQDNPKIKDKRRVIPLFIEGTWDGDKFVSYDDKGLEIIVRKKEWIIFKCQWCFNMGTPKLHSCPQAQEINGDNREICNCCHVCVECCANDI